MCDSATSLSFEGSTDDNEIAMKAVGNDWALKDWERIQSRAIMPDVSSEPFEEQPASERPLSAWRERAQDIHHKQPIALNETSTVLAGSVNSQPPPPSPSFKSSSNRKKYDKALRRKRSNPSLTESFLKRAKEIRKNAERRWLREGSSESSDSSTPYSSDSTDSDEEERKKRQKRKRKKKDKKSSNSRLTHPLKGRNDGCDDDENEKDTKRPLVVGATTTMSMLHTPDVSSGTEVEMERIGDDEKLEPKNKKKMSAKKRDLLQENSTFLDVSPLGGRGAQDTTGSEGEERPWYEQGGSRLPTLPPRSATSATAGGDDPLDIHSPSHKEAGGRTATTVSSFSSQEDTVENQELGVEEGKRRREKGKTGKRKKSDQKKSSGSGSELGDSYSEDNDDEGSEATSDEEDEELSTSADLRTEDASADGEEKEKRRKLRAKRKKKLAEKKRRRKRNKLRVQKFWNDCIPYNISDTPACPGPFFPDILIQILLFIPLMDLSTLLAASRVNRAWHFFTNYLPHWSYYQVFRSSAPQLAIPQKKSRHHILEAFQTQQLLIGKAEFAQTVPERKLRKSWGICIPTQLVHISVLLTVVVALYWMAWAIGHNNSHFQSDGQIGAMTFFSVFFVIVSFGLITLKFTEDDERHNQKRRAILISALFVVSFLLIVPMALLAARIGVAEELSTHLRHVTVSEIRRMSCPEITEWRPISYFTFDGVVVSSNGWREVFPSAYVQGVDGVGNVRSNGQGVRYLTTADGVAFHLFAKTSFTTPAACNNTGPMYVAFFGTSLATGSLSSYKSFRAVIPTRTYNSDVHYSVSKSAFSKWFQLSNVAWSTYHAFLLRSDMPETPQQGSARVDRLYRDRNILIMVGCFLLLVAIIASSQMRRRYLKYGQNGFGILALATLSPPVILAAGVVCVVKNEQGWAMCDRSAGGGLITLGVCLCLWMLSALCD